MGPDPSRHLDRDLLYKAEKKPALAVQQHRTEAKWTLSRSGSTRRAKIEAAFS
ncbi:hypothetical protein [Roseiarcus sp.]|uniref:hypothetical protein n=1 Tax=Roseiarcus sp. TaxID=1969460 RepID=UPI003F98ECFC